MLVLDRIELYDATTPLPAPFSPARPSWQASPSTSFLAGDSVLAGFDSVVEAVEGAAEARAEIGAFGAKTA